jgi:hypothetical protein
VGATVGMTSLEGIEMTCKSESRLAFSVISIVRWNDVSQHERVGKRVNCRSAVFITTDTCRRLIVGNAGGHPSIRVSHISN